MSITSTRSTHGISMHSDQSQLQEYDQAFVRMVDLDVNRPSSRVGDDSHSMSSSISSSFLDSCELHGQLSMSPSLDDADIIQSNYSADSEISCEGDEVAGFMSNVASSNGAQNITNLLMKRASIVESITLLGNHVPKCVMHDLTLEVLRKQKRMEQSKLIIPHSQTYSAALLFVDISGFTKLSLLMNLESLSRVCMLPLTGLLRWVLFNVNLSFVICIDHKLLFSKNHRRGHEQRR